MKKLVILGGGESGVGTALLAKMKGFEVFLSDSGNMKPHLKEELNNAAIRFEEGGHSEEEILSADEVVKSPGIPEKAPIIKALRAKGVKMFLKLNLLPDIPRLAKFASRVQTARQRQRS